MYAVVRCQVVHDVVTVTFNAKPTVFGGPYYEVCVQTDSANEFSFHLLETAGLRLPVDCLTLDCPTNVVVSTTNPAGAVVRFDPAPHALSICGSNVVITCEPPSGSVFLPGVTVVSCSAVDSRGNQAECQFLVTVEVLTPLEVRSVENGRLEFRWTGDDILEATEALQNRPNWQSVLSVPRMEGDERVFVLPVSAGQRFFRTRPLTP